MIILKNFCKKDHSVAELKMPLVGKVSIKTDKTCILALDYIVCVFVIPSNSAPFIVQLLYFPRSSLIYCTFIPKLKYVYYFYFQHDPLFLYPVNRLILYPVNRFSPPTFLLLCVSHCISWFARVVFFYQNLVCPIICKESKKCKKDFEISLPGDLSPFSFSLTIASSTKNVVWQGGTN